MMMTTLTTDLISHDSYLQTSYSVMSQQSPLYSRNSLSVTDDKGPLLHLQDSTTGMHPG